MQLKIMNMNTVFIESLLPSLHNVKGSSEGMVDPQGQLLKILQKSCETPPCNIKFTLLTALYCVCRRDKK